MNSINSVGIDWSEIEHFTPSEFAGEMDRHMVYMLDNARRLATERAEREVPFNLGDTVRTSGTSAHVTGHAVDIRCSAARERFYIVYGLILAGFTRIGVYDLHIHADNSPDHDPEVLWPGKSK